MTNRTAVFHPTEHLPTITEAAKLLGMDASVHLDGIELGAGVIVSAEPIEQFGCPGLWVTMTLPGEWKPIGVAVEQDGATP